MYKLSLDGLPERGPAQDEQQHKQHDIAASRRPRSKTRASEYTNSPEQHENPENQSQCHDTSPLLTSIGTERPGLTRTGRA